MCDLQRGLGRGKAKDRVQGLCYSGGFGIVVGNWEKVAPEIENLADSPKG